MTVFDREADLQLVAKCLSRNAGPSLTHPGSGNQHFHLFPYFREPFSGRFRTSCEDAIRVIVAFLKREERSE